MKGNIQGLPGFGPLTVKHCFPMVKDPDDILAPSVGCLGQLRPQCPYSF
eukprot:11407.XXX_107793_107939_1 [CDS] Oithona nana genome sequencing.